MNYFEAERLIFGQLPNFQKQGFSAIKYNLDNIKALCQSIGNPQDRLTCVHVAGTNGKGSCSHFVASILQESGLSVGLYTSPHLKNYRERFKINGELIPEEVVTEFVNLILDGIETLNPTFFEVSVALAFFWFSKSGVDIAVIEVGLGGRLDSTNIITPVLSIITSIGLDHQKFLGDTRAEIAAEKSGIIKPGIPVVIGERDAEIEPVFVRIAKINKSPIFFSDDIEVTEVRQENGEITLYAKSALGIYHVHSPLAGAYQVQNICTVLRSVEILNKTLAAGIIIDENAIKLGLRNVVKHTGLMGRWQKLADNPLTICDTGHNEAAWKYLGKQIDEVSLSGKKHIILGFANDKDVMSIIRHLPFSVQLYFTEFDSNRSLKCEEAKVLPINFIQFYTNVNIAYESVKHLAAKDDFIFIGGSTFVVAEINIL